MPTQEKGIVRVVKKISQPCIGYKPKEYIAEYDKCKNEEDFYSGRLWHNKEEVSRAKYPLLIRDDIAGILYLRVSQDESKALKGFVEKAVHILGKNVLEDKVNALLVKEVRQCNGKCRIFNS